MKALGGLFQVHISQVGQDKMRISWITDSPTPTKVDYGPTPLANAFIATGTNSSYHYGTYQSGEIHNVVIGPLKPNTVYYYRLGDSQSAKTYNFKTPPSQFPIKFAVVGKYRIFQCQEKRNILSKNNVSIKLLY